MNNVGGLDRLFRLAIGFASLAILFAVEETALRLLLGIVALVGLGTGIVGYCPINRMLGLNTSAKDKK
jgi:Inner membrane protein YgaP-like, transmembrane domain